MEKNNRIKVYLVLNKDIDVKFKCTDKSLKHYLDRGEHFTIIAEFYEMIDNEFYLYKLNEGMRLPPDPLPNEEIIRISQKSKSENNSDTNRLVREIYRLQEQIIQYQSEVGFLKSDKLFLEKHLENSRPSYKKMLRENTTIRIEVDLFT